MLPNSDTFQSRYSALLDTVSQPEPHAVASLGQRRSPSPIRDPENYLPLLFGLVGAVSEAITRSPGDELAGLLPTPGSPDQVVLEWPRTDLRALAPGLPTLNWRKSLGRPVVEPVDDSFRDNRIEPGS